MPRVLRRLGRLVGEVVVYRNMLGIGRSRMSGAGRTLVRDDHTVRGYMADWHTRGSVACPCRVATGAVRDRSYPMQSPSLLWLPGPMTIHCRG